MSIKEKLTLIEECMDIDEGTLKEEDVLNDYEEWDSVSMLSVLAMIAEKFQRTVSAEALRVAKTVSDVLELMK